jgi:hypothetical protein
MRYFFSERCVNVQSGKGGGVGKFPTRAGERKGRFPEFRPANVLSKQQEVCVFLSFYPSLFDKRPTHNDASVVFTCY